MCMHACVRACVCASVNFFSKNKTTPQKLLTGLTKFHGSVP